MKQKIFMQKTSRDKSINERHDSNGAKLLFIRLSYDAHM